MSRGWKHGLIEGSESDFGVDSVVGALLDTHLDQTWGGLDRARRLALFRGLDERGVFAVRRAIEQVAARLGISRASAYSCLSQARAAGTTGHHDPSEGAHP